MGGRTDGAINGEREREREGGGGETPLCCIQLSWLACEFLTLFERKLCVDFFYTS